MRKIITAASLAVFAMAQPGLAASLFPDLYPALHPKNKTEVPNAALAAPIGSGCNIGGVLRALRIGDPKTFDQSVARGEASLREAGISLAKVIALKRYERPIKASKVAILSSIVKPQYFKNGDDILRGIKDLVDQSHETLKKMQDGQGTLEDLSLLVQNNSDVSQLILAFYAALKVG